MPELHDVIPAWLVAVAYAVAMFVAGEAGFRIGRGAKKAALLETPPEFVLTAAFTLVALLMAFSFSMALGHFDARSDGVLREADAVRVVAARSDLLEPRAAAEVRSALREYARTRLAFSDPSSDADARRRASAASELLLTHLWRTAVEAADRNPQSATLPLVLQALNDLSAACNDEASVRAAHVPESVVLMLGAISFIAIGLMGFRLGRLGEPAQIGCAILAVMLALAVGMIIDLDHPGREFIRVGLEPLQAALNAIPQ